MFKQDKVLVQINSAGNLFLEDKIKKSEDEVAEKIRTVCINPNLPVELTVSDIQHAMSDKVHIVLIMKSDNFSSLPNREKVLGIQNNSGLMLDFFIGEKVCLEYLSELASVFPASNNSGIRLSMIIEDDGAGDVLLASTKINLMQWQPQMGYQVPAQQRHQNPFNFNVSGVQIIHLLSMDEFQIMFLNGGNLPYQVDSSTADIKIQTKPFSLPQQEVHFHQPGVHRGGRRTVGEASVDFYQQQPHFGRQMNNGFDDQPGPM